MPLPIGQITAENADRAADHLRLSSPPSEKKLRGCCVDRFGITVLEVE
jgi:hypothetical protein